VSRSSKKEEFSLQLATESLSWFFFRYVSHHSLVKRRFRLLVSSDRINCTTNYFMYVFQMALFDLKENAVMQVIGFVVLLATSISFIVLFISQGINMDNISLWGTEWESLFGVVLFNFALVIAIPAW